MISSVVERSARATSISFIIQKHVVSCLHVSALLPSELSSLHVLPARLSDMQVANLPITNQ